MSSLQQVLTQIEDELSVEVWSAYGGGKHFAAETVILQLLLSLAFAYLTTLLGVERTAEEHRRAFSDFLRKTRFGEASAGAPEVLRNQTQARLDEARERSEWNRHEAARARIEEMLVEAGLTQPAARDHARRIKELFQKELGGSRP